jgi:hypothetical protein
LFVTGVSITSSTYDADYQGAVSDNKKYIETDNFIELQCVNDMVVSNITKCPSASISTPSPANPSMYIFLRYSIHTEHILYIDNG